MISLLGFDMGCVPCLGLRPLDAYWHVINQRPIHSRPIRWRRRGCAWTDWQTSRVQSSSRGSSLVTVIARTPTGPGPNCTTPVSIEQGRMSLSLYSILRGLSWQSLVKVCFCACSFCVLTCSRLGWFEIFRLVRTRASGKDFQSKKLCCWICTTKYSVSLCSCIMKPSFMFFRFYDMLF